MIFRLAVRLPRDIFNLEIDYYILLSTCRMMNNLPERTVLRGGVPNTAMKPASMNHSHRAGFISKRNRRI
jgi:hypothetical protein